jgi:serine/threonine-protein kinase
MGAEPRQVAAPTIAGYTVLRRIGQGTHGTVQLAQHGQSGQMVALKLISLPGGPGATAARESFVQSAEAAMRLQHPGIVALYGVGIERSTGWLAMEPVPGSDLGRYTHAARLLPERVVLVIAKRVAQALAHAHRHSVMHRDVKPANVLVDWPGDLCKLADFGLARAVDASRTATGVVPGSPAYMAPELLAGAVPTPQSDLYALGVMLFELLVGRLPHTGASMGELLRQVASQPAPDLRSLKPALPAALAQTVARLLAKRPAERPSDGDALAEALSAVMPSLPGRQ